LNQTGGFVMRAEKVGADTLLSQIVHMVAAAQRSRAPIQRMADQVAGWFVPVVMLVAALTFAVWLVWGPSPAFSYALITAVAVLIIACPCALGLATPMSIMVGVGKGAQHGVLIRDAEALEKMEKVDTLVVDKTGTLTEGRPKVVHIEAAAGFGADDVLQRLASVERASEHPLAMAIVMDAQERKLTLLPVTDFDSPVGKGVIGTVDAQVVVSGSAKFLAEHAIDSPPCRSSRSATAEGCHGHLRRHRRPAGRFCRDCRPYQGHDTAGAEGPPDRWRAGGHADGRRQDDGRGCGPRTGYRRGGGGSLPRGQGSRGQAPAGRRPGGGDGR
jgi:Cu+-exporting ATPase